MKQLCINLKTWQQLALFMNIEFFLLCLLLLLSQDLGLLINLFMIVIRANPCLFIGYSFESSNFLCMSTKCALFCQHWMTLLFLLVSSPFSCNLLQFCLMFTKVVLNHMMAMLKLKILMFGQCIHLHYFLFFIYLPFGIETFHVHGFHRGFMGS